MFCGVAVIMKMLDNRAMVSGLNATIKMYEMPLITYVWVWQMGRSIFHIGVFDDGVFSQDPAYLISHK